MKLAVVVQRYGLSINGGAELHARYIAEHLARHADVEVLTTCAVDYVTWKNDLPAGVEQINGVTTRRFKVRHQRHPQKFGRWSQRVFEEPHSLADELTWLDAEGPASPALVRYIARQREQYDYFIFFSYRYYHAYHGVRAAAGRAVLVPTAERDSAVGLSIFRPIFSGVRALMYNSPEERAMIHAVANNASVPGVVVGIGSEIPGNPQAARFRQKFNIKGPFAVYVGRIDENKGCPELFDFFQAYLKAEAGNLSLVLIGKSILPIPDHPRIRHLGFLDDQDKFDALAASDLLIMPSYFESLSMVALEAWAMGRPVLANARCEVLKGQCIRSNAGLYYENKSEFVGALTALEHQRWLSGSLGRNGRTFYRDHYDWPIIERKYLDMLAHLSATPQASVVEALPGWFARRSETCKPGSQVLRTIPLSSSHAVERIVLIRPTPPPPVQSRPEPPRPAPARPAQSNPQSHSHSRSGRHHRRGGPPRRRSV